MKPIFIILPFLTLLFTQCRKENNPFANNNGNYNHNRETGASSGDLLSGNKYNSLKIEIQYMPGFQPDAAAVDHLVNLLQARLNKPGGISVVQKQISASAAANLSAADVSAIENANRTVFSNGSEMGVYILLTNGLYTNTNVLGIAYRNTSVCLFGKKINDNSGGVGQASRTKLTATVLEHELGHLLGLVNNGTPMVSGHQDAANGAHCNSNSCLMYYASETSDVFGFLITGNIPALDAACIADLRANGGK